MRKLYQLFPIFKKTTRKKIKKLPPHCTPTRRNVQSEIFFEVDDRCKITPGKKKCIGKKNEVREAHQ